MKKILLIGGSGYIGHVLTDYLLKKDFKVHVIDNLIYNQHNVSLNHHTNKNFSFDFLDLKNISNFIKKRNFHSIVILGGLVGDPITKKYSTQSKIINEKYIKSLIEIVIKNKICKKTIFISTCSNYGIDKDKILDENSELKPLSSYAKSKVNIENFIINNFGQKNFSPTILRFATAFGVSSRMRFDLTLNEFTKEIFYKNKLEVYDAETWRPYCHVLDFARAITLVINSKMSLTHNQIYNVGSNKNNYTKKGIIEVISKYLSTPNIKYINKSIDMRNYRVNFEKIRNKLKFEAKYSVEYGIKEIIQSLNKNYYQFNNINEYGNYLIDSFEKKKI